MAPQRCKKQHRIQHPLSLAQCTLCWYSVIHLLPACNKQIVCKFHGILNGIDFADWNPADDALLPANYNATSMEGKAICKEYLQRVSAHL